MNHARRFCIRHFFIYFYINSIFCFFFNFWPQFWIESRPSSKKLFAFDTVLTRGKHWYFSKCKTYCFCTDHSVARYSVTSILVQILRDFVPREPIFFTLIDWLTDWLIDWLTDWLIHRITEWRNDRHVKVLWNRYSFADIPMKNYLMS